MKCISLWQPWASLVAIGAKTCETRSWETLYRGPLAIHAAKKWNRELERLCFTSPFLGALRQNKADADQAMIDEMPFGAIVATVRLVDCVYIEPRTTPIESDERAFGDYTPGRFRWDLTDLRRLDTPIPWKGAQGLFDIPDDVIDAARRAGGEETRR